MQNTQTFTLQELIRKTARVSPAAKTPTPAALKKSCGEPLTQIPGLRVYGNGYAVYENASGRSVFPVEDGRSFTFSFQPARPGQPSEVADSCRIPERVMDGLPWYVPLTLAGDYRVENNRRLHRREYSLEAMLPGEGGALAGEGGPGGAERNACEGPERALIRKENLREMLEALTARQREVFTCCCLEGRSQQEAAESLGIARSAVSRSLSRALARIRSLDFN